MIGALAGLIQDDRKRLGESIDALQQKVAIGKIKRDMKSYLDTYGMDLSSENIRAHGKKTGNYDWKDALIHGVTAWKKGQTEGQYQESPGQITRDFTGKELTRGLDKDEKTPDWLLKVGVAEKNPDIAKKYPTLFGMKTETKPDAQKKFEWFQSLSDKARLQAVTTIKQLSEASRIPVEDRDLALAVRIASDPIAMIASKKPIGERAFEILNAIKTLRGENPEKVAKIEGELEIAKPEEQKSIFKKIFNDLMGDTGKIKKAPETVDLPEGLQLTEEDISSAMKKYGVGRKAIIDAYRKNIKK